VCVSSWKYFTEVTDYLIVFVSSFTLALALFGSVLYLRSWHDKNFHKLNFNLYISSGEINSRWAMGDIGNKHLEVQLCVILGFVRGRLSFWNVCYCDEAALWVGDVSISALRFVPYRVSLWKAMDCSSSALHCACAVEYTATYYESPQKPRLHHYRLIFYDDIRESNIALH
jgi:hypothetical protein